MPMQGSPVSKDKNGEATLAEVIRRQLLAVQASKPPVLAIRHQKAATLMIKQEESAADSKLKGKKPSLLQQ